MGEFLNFTYFGVVLKLLWNMSSGTIWGTTGGGLENDIKSGESFAALFLLCEGGGANNEFDGLWEWPGLGLDLLNWRSYLIEAESVSLIEEARVTTKNK